MIFVPRLPTSSDSRSAINFFEGHNEEFSKIMVKKKKRKADKSMITKISNLNAK